MSQTIYLLYRNGEYIQTSAVERAHIINAEILTRTAE